MNATGVSVTPGAVVFPGVAEAAAAKAAPTSLAELFGQILANAQAGIAAGAESAVPPGEDGDAQPESDAPDAASILASALSVMAPASAIAGAPPEETAVLPVTPIVSAAIPEAVNTALVAADDAEAAQVAALLQPTDGPEASPPAMTLAMQLAAARAGLGPEGAPSARRFGDADITPGKTLPAESPAGEATAKPAEPAPPVNAVQAPQESSAGNDGAEDAQREAFALKTTLGTPKPGESSPFDVKTPMFAGAEVQATGQTRTEPAVMPVAKDVPQSVSVREVGDVIVRSVQYHSGRTEDVVTVRLVPQSLGELRIAVHAGERGMEVVLTAANNAAREALESNMAGLREALGREGMAIERVSVQVFAPFDAGQQPASQQNTPGNAGQSSRQPNTAYRESSGSPPQQHNSSEQQPRRQQHAGRLNMWV